MRCLHLHSVSHLEPAVWQSVIPIPKSWNLHHYIGKEFCQLGWKYRAKCVLMYLHILPKQQNRYSLFRRSQVRLRSTGLKIAPGKSCISQSVSSQMAAVHSSEATLPLYSVRECCELCLVSLTWTSITTFPSWSCSQAVWHIPLLCVQWKTPADGQRNCPKHVEFYSKNKFEELVHLVGFIIRTSHTSINVYSYMHQYWSLHPLCSWSGYRPDQVVLPNLLITSVSLIQSTNSELSRTKAIHCLARTNLPPVPICSHNDRLHKLIFYLYNISLYIIFQFTHSSGICVFPSDFPNLILSIYHACYITWPIAPYLIFILRCFNDEYHCRVINIKIRLILHWRRIYVCCTTLSGHAVAQLVEALRNKPEDRGFDSRRCHRNFSLT